MHHVVLALLLAVSAPQVRFYFIGTLGKSENVDVTLRMLPGGEVVGATFRAKDDLRLLRGRRDGQHVLLHEIDAEGHETARIDARFVKKDLKGKWQQRPFDFWESPINETPLMYERSYAWPALRRLHDAIRASNWKAADEAARIACGFRDEGCPWIEAIPAMQRGEAPPGELPPWGGLLLERAGKYAEAIAAYQRHCGIDYVVCLLLNDLSPRMSPGERDALQQQICSGYRIACDEIFGAPQVALSDAARRGDLAAVEKLLREGAKVNFGNSGRVLSPLLGATLANSLPVVKVLLDHGADPNADYGYEAPLEAAVGNKHDDIAMLLLDRGANPNVGNPPLWTAVYNRRHALARKLVDHGAHIDDTVPAGSALTAAVDNGDVEMVRFLLAHGADPDQETKFSGGSPIDHARRQHRTKILKMLRAAEH